MKFSDIQKIAQENSGGENALAARLPDIPDQDTLLAISDEDYLSMMMFPGIFHRTQSENGPQQMARL